jgi:hypothetical protein
MRIIFAVRIAPVISEADVSHNGLFIGLWTEAEVSLGFVVACALCFPKLVQAKGIKIKKALTKASSPFSSFRGTVHSMSRKDPLPSEQTESDNPIQGQREQTDPARAPAQQERYYQQHAQSPPQAQLQQPTHVPVGHLHPNVYAQPVTASSSVYSQSPEPRHSGNRDRSASRDSSIRVAPLRVSMYGPDGRYLGARSPARQLSSSEERLQQSRELETREESFSRDYSITLPVPPKSPRRQSNHGVEERGASVQSPTRMTREGMTAEQLRAEVEMLQQFNFEMTRQSMESPRRSRPTSYALSHR